MKFVLLSVVCLAGVALALPASTKQKRDILPGDPRYGTDYHHQHHHHHEEAGDHQVPHAQYGPPQATHQPEAYHYKPAGSSGHDHVNNGYLAPAANSNYANANAQNNAYLAPSASGQQAPAVRYTTQAPVYHQQVPSNNYLGPAIQESIQKPFAQYGPPASQQYKPAPVQTHVLAHAANHAEQQTQQSIQNLQEQISVHQSVQAEQPTYQPQAYSNEYNGFEILGDAESSGVQQVDQTVLTIGGNEQTHPDIVYNHQYDVQPKASAQAKAPAQHYIPQQQYQPAPTHQENTQLIGANGGYVY